MRLEKERLRKMFPNLAAELDGKPMSVKIRSVRSDAETAEKVGVSKENFSGYNPDVIDFIRRCDTEKEALKIIAFLEERSEISREYGRRLREQLKRKGLRSFGPKKEHDYYLKRAGYG